MSASIWRSNDAERAAVSIMIRRGVMNYSMQRRLLMVLGLTAAPACGTDRSTGPNDPASAASYALSLTPAALTIVQGATGTATISINRTSFSGAVTLTLSGTPFGIIRSFSPEAPVGDGATLTIGVGATMAPGVYNLAVNGAALLGNRSTPLTLTVKPSLESSGIITAVAGTEYSCALKGSGQAYCWGSNFFNELGAPSSETCVDPRFGSNIPCSTRPLPVSGGLTFASLSAYWYHQPCAISTSGEAYCWGGGATTPTPVPGGFTFAQINGPCAVTTSGAAYCGISASTAPTLVPGGLTFATVTVNPSTRGNGGFGAACGVTTKGVAYCWGENGSGQLGDGTTTDHLVPTPVAGGLEFATLSAGWAWTCGIATTGVAYCWGGSAFGALGDGSTTNRLVPTPVAGGLTFATISAGDGHTCGVTLNGEAYCWGFNAYGQLGDGTTTNQIVPTRVTGGHKFAMVSAGPIVPFLGHTCGVTTSGEVYCWGDNFGGELGDGTTTQHLVPTLVNFP
jgi:alpha-tubulin suppressor-like RCC1 family protein